MADAIALWLDGAGRHPLLTGEQEIELGRAVQSWQQAEHPTPAAVARGLRARDKLVTCNLRWAAALARRYREKTTVPFEDILQAGAMGLIRAAERFDPERGYKFSTYATCWIRQSITRTIERTEPICGSRLPNWLQGKIGLHRRELAVFHTTHGRYPGAVEAAEMRAALGLSAERWRDAVQWLGVAPALDAPVGDGETTMGELIAASIPGPEEATELTELREMTDKVLSCLPPRYAQALGLRYGIGGDEPKSLEAIATAMGISRARAGQIVNAGMRKLRARYPRPALPAPALPDQGDQQAAA
jgi:RNA polymerase primary sigma factor